MSAIHPGFEFTWLGHSAFLIRTPGGANVAIDPWLDNPSCPESAKELPKLDLVLLTHGHGDHIGDAPRLAKRDGAPLVAIHELACYMAAQGVENTIGMNKGGSVDVAGLHVTMVNALHSSASVEDGGKITYLGEAAGFVVRCEDGFTFYFAGDTGVFSDMRLISQLYRPDLAFLPIGDLYTMGPKEAACAIELLGVKKVVPMHYGTFPALTGTPEALREAARGVQGLEVFSPAPGETL